MSIKERRAAGVPPPPDSRLDKAVAEFFAGIGLIGVGFAKAA